MCERLTLNISTTNPDKAVIEEDWSSSYNGSHNLTGFAQHDKVTIKLSSSSDDTTCSRIPKSQQHESPSKELVLNCVESLTPLDMLHLSNGDDDSTGHRIWMGALFFMECFACALPDNNWSNHNGDDNDSEEKQTMIMLLSEWRKKLFHQKDILELGSGTGVSGISLIVAGTSTFGNSNCDSSDGEVESKLNNCAQPNSIIFTDSDPSVLELCRKNINNNVHEKIKSNYFVSQLTWGQNNDSLNKDSNVTKSSGDEEINIQSQLIKAIEPHSIDCVIATDVIYDISAIIPLFQTAASVIKQKGYFILSHIPRASINCTKKGENVIRNEIEFLILEAAADHGFKNTRWEGGDDHCIRPNDLFKIRRKMVTSDELSYDEMESVGAGIFIFEYNGSNS